MLDIQLFGGLTIRYNGSLLNLPSQASRSLFAYLAVHAQSTHMRSRLVGLFWPERDESSARRRLSHALWEIGTVLPEREGQPYVRRNGETLLFNLDLPHRLDVVEFRAEWQRAQMGDDETTLPRLQRMVKLYVGEMLAGYYDEWILVEQERLREIYLQVLLRRVTLEKRAGTFEGALQTCLILIAADPLREESYQEGIRLYYHLGREQEARQLFERCQAILATELGVTVDAATVDLLTEIDSGNAGRGVEQTPFAFGSHSDLPLVGRARERRQILRHLEASRAGSGGLILLEGEAGIGKSRFLRALAEDATWRGIDVLWGQGREFSEQMPYAPILEALQSYLSPVRAQKQATVLEPLWLGVVARLLPSLTAWLPDLPQPPALEPAQARLRLLEGLVRFSLAFDHNAPLLIVLDDLHWADASTFDALVYLARQLTQRRVLVIASYREEEAHARADVWLGLERVDRVGVLQRLRLSALNGEETVELVRRSLGMAASAQLFSARLFEETHGNPLFVLETLRALQADGMLVHDDQRHWSTPFDGETVDYSELPLAPSMLQTITKRLDRLQPAERSVLSAAAIIGREVSLPLLNRMVTLRGQHFLPLLSALTRQRLLEESPSAYHFSHDKVQQAVYETIPAAERRALHQRAAHLLLTEPTTHAALLAYHFDAGEQYNEAASWHLRAGEEATTVHAFGAALTHFDRAESLVQDDEPQDDFRYTLASLRERVLDVLGERMRQLQELDLLEALTQDDPSRLMLVHRRRAQYFCVLAQYEKAAIYARKSLALADELADIEGRASALIIWGQTLSWGGNPVEAVKILKVAVAASQKSGARKTAAEAQQLLCSALFEQSQHEEAKEAAAAAMKIYQALDDPIGEADVLTTLGALYVEWGELDEAERCYVRALTIQNKVGYRYGECRTALNWGTINFLRGEIGLALERFETAKKLADEIDSERIVNAANLNIAAAVSTFIGDLPQGRQAIEAVLATLATDDNPTLQAQAEGIYAQFDMLAGDFEAAQRRLALCVALQSGTNSDPWILAQGYQQQAYLFLYRQTYADALNKAKQGEAYCREFGFAELRPSFLAIQARALLEIGRVEEALSLAEAAVGALRQEQISILSDSLLPLRWLSGIGRMERAVAALAQAKQGLEAMLASLAPDDAAHSRRMIGEHRAILEAWEQHRPLTQHVLLPRADAPIGRVLTDDEQTTILWTVESVADRPVRNKTQRRYQQILRLLHEAQAQAAVPAYHHLAAALAVSERTILRDMAALRRLYNTLPPTRGEVASTLASPP